jgi:hypothetical protein
MNKDTHGIFDAYCNKIISEMVRAEHLNSKPTFAENLQDYLAYLNDVDTFIKSYRDESAEKPESSLLVTFSKAAIKGANELANRIAKDIYNLTKGDINAESTEITKLRHIRKRVKEIEEDLKRNDMTYMKMAAQKILDLKNVLLEK